MVTTYQEFKDYLVDFLWKKSDALLIANLDNLIRQGENMINRDLDEELRHYSVNMLVTDQRMALPQDYKSMRQVVDIDGNLGELHYVSPASLEAKRKRSPNMWLPYYSLEAGNIMFAGPTSGGRKTTGPTPPANPEPDDLWLRTTNPQGLYQWIVDPTSSQWVQIAPAKAIDFVDEGDKNVVIHYVRKIPSFQDTGTTWLLDDNLDLMTYATLYHSSPFLREDERVQVWQGMYNTIITKMNDDSAFNKQHGVFGPMPPARRASGRKRKTARPLSMKLYPNA